MRVYSKFVYASMESFLLSCFPVTRLVLGTRKWNTIARDFFSNHRCQTPYFREIPKEFLLYLEQERGNRPGDPPFLFSLAHYEWIELALSISNIEVDWTTVDTASDLLDEELVFNPVLSLLSYPFAVHRIGPKYIPAIADAEPTHLLVFRNQDDEVKFIELNSISARLLNLLLHEKATGKEALYRIAKELNQSDAKMFLSFGAELLNDLREQQVIFGVSKTSLEKSSDKY